MFDLRCQQFVLSVLALVTCLYRISADVTAPGIGHAGHHPSCQARSDVIHTMMPWSQYSHDARTVQQPSLPLAYACMAVQS